MPLFDHSQPGPDVSIETLHFQDDGLLPNNPKLPVMLYKGALREYPDRAETVFNSNGWLNSWQNGVFSYHHYHSNTHEVLGVMSGEARLQLGGDSGQTIEVSAGDVLVLPAGTAHKRLAGTADFRVAGAYPDGADYNTRRATLADKEAALPEIARVPLPGSDPVYGKPGPLRRAWGAEG